MAYTTLAALKSYLGLTPTGDDALLADCIVRAQAMIDTHCGRTFEALLDSTRGFDAQRDVSRDGRTLFIDDDLAQVTSVTNAGQVVPAEAYIVEPGVPPYFGLRLRRSSGLTWAYDDDPEDAIEVQGRWAWSITPPADIQHACLRLAAYLYRQRDRGSEGDRPLVTADGFTLLPARLPNDVLAILSPYQRRVR